MVAPLPDNEPDRLDWLRQSSLLDTPAEAEFDDLVRLAAQVCGVPIAAVSLVDEKRQWFKSVTGLGITETPRDRAFCAHTILQREVMVVPDATEDRRFSDNPLVTGEDHFRFYAGAPLLTSDGFALGSLCVIDRIPRQITEQQAAVLQVLASQLAGRIEMRRRILLQDILVQEQRKLVQRQEELLTQKKRLIAERAQAEEDAARTEQRLLFAVEGAGIGTWSWEIGGDDLGWSESCKALFGLRPEERMTRDRLYASLHPDDREPTRRAIEKALADGTIYDTEYRAVWPDGSEHWRAARGRGYYGSDGQLLRFDGTIQDIEGKKAEQERQRTLLRDVLASVTGGKLRLVEAEAELPEPLSEVIGQVHLTLTEGLRALRQTVREEALRLDFAEVRWQDVVTAASEGGMNAVTHGGGQGISLVLSDGRDMIQVRVQDWGQGINVENLPKATLSRGWSSTTSLGHGLAMMLQSVDRLWLLTGNGGTTVVLEQGREEPVPVWL